MLKIKLLFAFFFFMTIAFGQTFSGMGGVIKDDASRNQFTVVVSGLATSINSSFGVYGVTVNITHSYAADLDVFLIAPDNTLIELSSANGGSTKNYSNCLFTNNSSNKISSSKGSLKGNYKPEGSIGVANNGQNPNATWRLVIVDTKPNRDSGTLLNWNIIFNSKPSVLEPFVNSALPLILINTNGKGIPDDPRIYAKMRIINNVNAMNSPDDSLLFFNHGITIETRGSSSQSFPKKPYGFSTVLTNLSDTNVSLLGLPSEHDWVLNATYNDKSLMRDVLAYELARRSGRYATRYRYCELFINGLYQGIYILMEKVKRDKNRVDITKLELKDSTGNALTGGYIVKIDKTTGNNNGGWTDSFPISPGSSGRVYFQYDYPNGDAMVKKQRDYIASAIYKFEIALASSSFASLTKGYRQYADESTFIDLSIINDISKNVDGYRLSTYLYKDRDSKGGKLKMGPVWDFNLAFNNADYNNSSDPSGWEMDISGGCPFWWQRLRQDTGYINSYYCRWNQLRQSSFSLYNINQFLDSTYKVLEEASYRNFQRWPVMGIYIWPNPSPLSYSMREEVDSLKSWIAKRVSWMDATLAVDCKSVKTCAPKVVIFSDKKTVCRFQSVKLYADGVGNSFKWYAASGAIIKSGRETIVYPDTSSTYKVVMQTSTGCKDSAYIFIKVLPLPSKKITGKTSFCEGENTTLNVPAGYETYLWSPASGLDNTTTPQVIASYKQTLVYKVVITDSMGCHDSSFVGITVNKKPVVVISAGRDTICSMDSIELKTSGAAFYQWLPVQGLKDTAGNTVIVYPLNTTYTVIGKSSKACLDTASYTIFNFARAPLSIMAVDTQLCFRTGTLLTAKNGSNYSWQKTVDFNGSNSSTINIFPKINTNYLVKGWDKNGCSDSAGIAIKVYPEINMSVTVDSVVCEGDEATFIASGADTYQWSTANGIVLGSVAQLAVRPIQITYYKVIGMTLNSCSDTNNFKVLVNVLPVLKIVPSALSIEEGKQDTLMASGANQYLWSPAASLHTDTGKMVIASPLVSTMYYLKGTSAEQCTAMDSVFIKVTKKVINNGVNTLNATDFLLYPNPANDFVTIESLVPARLIVYNMQGMEVYKTQIGEGANRVVPGLQATGIYIFCLQTAQGSLHYKVVLE